MAEHLAYNNFRKFYNNLIERGGNIGTTDGCLFRDPLEHPKRWTSFIRKYHNNINWEHYYTGYQLDDFHRKVRSAIQCLWMADQQITFKPVIRTEPSMTRVHPGQSRLGARWAQNLSTECIFLDFNFPDYSNIEKVPWTKFNNIDEAWNGLTYNNHIPSEVQIATYSEELVDATYEHEHYKKNGFINIFWCEDLKQMSNDQWHKKDVAKKYIKRYLTNPVQYGKRSFSV